MHDKSASKENNAPRTDSSNIDGFNKTWKGEEWKGEDWKDAWGNNGQPRSYQCFALFLYTVVVSPHNR